MSSIHRHQGGLIIFFLKKPDFKKIAGLFSEEAE